MCTYHGILEEYPLISIDSFESYNYTSTLFFITHIHLDHLVGLERPEFGRYVAKINAPIYMSDISKQLLSTMPIYRHLVPYFKSVPIDQSFTLTIRSNDPVQAKKKDGGDNESLKSTLAFHTPNVDETIVVTCFGSGHCPGSIMIWIEGAHGNVLFTGDFRLYHGQSKRLTHLHRRRTDNDDHYIFKPIDNLYIDMTFFRPEILHIPTREVSCEALILWIRALLKEESNVHFHFKQSARVGYEQIYRTLYENLNMRVHVEQSQYEFFACLPVIQECLTTDSTVTRLHACRSAASNYTEPCSLFRTCDKPIRIFLSIMWFTEQVAASELLVEYHEYHSNFNQNLTKRCLGFQDYEPVTTYPDKYLGYRLCYSLHSSFSEIVDVLKTLTPKRVTPIASPLISLMPTKRLFRTIDYFIRDRTNEQSREAISKKTVNTQIQLKHRYESFETKLERKRRRKLFKEQQQRRANDEELDLGLNDEREETLLQRIHSLNRVLIEQNKTPSSQHLASSVEIESDRLSIITCDHQPMELIYTKIHRERTMSETSSDTETYVALKFDSQPSSFIMSSIALSVLTLTLGMFFIFMGQFKITSRFFPDVYEDMKQEFGRNNKVFPFYQLTGWRPYARNYRLTVGIVEIVCGITLALIPGRLKQLANIILLILMLGAVYTHYALNDKIDRMAPGIIFSLLLFTRLLISRYSRYSNVIKIDENIKDQQELSDRKKNN